MNYSRLSCICCYIEADLPTDRLASGGCVQRASTCLLRINASDLSLEGVDALPESTDNSLTLAGNTLTCHKLGLGIGLRLDLGPARLHMEIDFVSVR